MPTFEFDPAKSAANRAKHGIDFVAGQALWQDDAAIEAPARTAGANLGSSLWARSGRPRGQR